MYYAKFRFIDLCMHILAHYQNVKGKHSLNVQVFQEVLMLYSENLEKVFIVFQIFNQNFSECFTNVFRV